MGRSLGFGIGLLAAVALLLGPTVTPMATAQTDAPTEVRIDLDSSAGSGAPKLGGLSWNAGGDLGLVEDIRPPAVRIDGALERVSPSEGVLELDRLLGRVAEIRRIGAEPLVILSYMPVWLGEPNAGGRDPTRVAPADLDKWETLITDVVRALATAPDPAYRFEVWNEPDLPVFFQDLPTTFMDMAARSHRAVATVAEETGLPLQIGGPATAAPDPVYMVPYVQRMVAEGLPLDFVSWHYYANHPFFGPDGNEGFVPDAVYEANARRNPLASPRLFGEQPAAVQAFIDPALAGSDLDPELLITEWNISAAGFDVRHASHEGAAFALGTLIELEGSGLDGADYYRAISDDVEHPGDWATVTASGDRRPSWWALQAWNDSADGALLALTGDDPAGGFWARAARLPDGRVDVFLTAFENQGDTSRTVDLVLDGACADPAGEVSFLSPDSADLSTYAPISFTDSRTTVDLPSQSAAVLRLRCGTGTAASTAAGGAPSAPGDQATTPVTAPLPATGGDHRIVGVALALVALVLGMRRRLSLGTTGSGAEAG